MNDEGIFRTAPAKPGLLITPIGAKQAEMSLEYKFMIHSHFLQPKSIKIPPTICLMSGTQRALTKRCHVGMYITLHNPPKYSLCMLLI